MKIPTNREETIYPTLSSDGLKLLADMYGRKITPVATPEFFRGIVDLEAAGIAVSRELAA